MPQITLPQITFSTDWHTNSFTETVLWGGGVSLLEIFTRPWVNLSLVSVQFLFDNWRRAAGFLPRRPTIKKNKKNIVDFLKRKRVSGTGGARCSALYRKMDRHAQVSQSVVRVTLYSIAGKVHVVKDPSLKDIDSLHSYDHDERIGR